ncbi:RTA1 like protein-domain-containing protein [Protomyces lactucae-debilis]|uniref:RTA1 like protein-domain-containing protein n=1 Tax=Protomyces lactucae-debilis TaxID=2754530 RepID=A0A1Y2FGT9_PROLT|nr:RTA1 like protein-domain-containing protein [Protomyces lactucae-debilis]ORY82496.1 RTA1 like protein-domain-containing protein [Protomyces lactucae-debilis]
MSENFPEGYRDPSRPNPGGEYSARIIIYGYTPSLSFAAVALATFGIMTIVHLYLTARYRTRYFSMVILGCIFEMVGYAFRMVSYLGNVYDYRWFVVSYFFLVVAPVLYSAAIYACMSSLVKSTGKWTPKQAKQILIVFVTFDVVCTVAQVAGAAGIGAASSNGKDPSNANKAVIAGLAVQTAAFLVFFILLSLFAFTTPYWNSMASVLTRSEETGTVIVQNPTRAKYHLLRAGRENIPSHILLLLAASFFIFLRTVFRLAESADGVNSKAATSEILFAMLDYFPVIIAVILLALGHPGKYTQENIARAEQAVVNKERA